MGKMEEGLLIIGLVGLNKNPDQVIGDVAILVSLLMGMAVRGLRVSVIKIRKELEDLFI